MYKRQQQYRTGEIFRGEVGRDKRFEHREEEQAGEDVYKRQHFPNDLAAEIAVQTVKEFLKKQTSVKKVIFNVFKDLDKEIYARLLGAN